MSCRSVKWRVPFRIGVRTLPISLFRRHSNSYPVECEHTAVAWGLQDFNCSVSYSRRVLGIPEWVRISNASCKYIVLFIVHSKHFFYYYFWLGLISRPMINYCNDKIWKLFTQHSLYGISTIALFYFYDYVCFCFSFHIGTLRKVEQQTS